METEENIEGLEEKKEDGSLIIDHKKDYKGQEYDGVRAMVKAIKKSLGPKRVD